MFGGLPIDIGAFTLGPQAAIPDFALSGYNDAREEALQNRATPEQAETAGLMGLVGGIGQYYLFEAASGKLNLTAGFFTPQAINDWAQSWAQRLAGRPGLSTLMDMTSSAAKTTSLAAVQNGYNNLVASMSGSDPNRRWDENTWRAVLSGALLDGVFSLPKIPALFGGLQTPRLSVRTRGGGGAPEVETRPETPAPAPTTGETLARPPVSLVPEGAPDQDHVDAFGEEINKVLGGQAVQTQGGGQP